MKNKYTSVIVEKGINGLNKGNFVSYICLGLILLLNFTLNAQTYRDFDTIQFYGTGNVSATQDLAYDFDWTRSSSGVVIGVDGGNGFMRMPRNTSVVTESLNFIYGDTLSIAYKVTNISGGGSVTRYFGITLIDEDDNETSLYTSPSIAVSTTDFECLVLVVHATGSYKVRFDYDATGGNSAHYLLFDNFTTYSPLTLLPVSLTSYESKLEKSDAIITWSTASEHNADIFEVEVSEDGQYFQSIGTVSASGSAYQAAEYQIIHYNAFAISQSKVLYYRLKMVDIDGSFTYSPLTEVMKSNDRVENKVTYNNPFGATLNIQVQEAGSIEKIILRDMQGKERISENNTVLNTSSLQIGIYYMTIYFNNGEVSTQKLIKN